MPSTNEIKAVLSFNKHGRNSYALQKMARSGVIWVLEENEGYNTFIDGNRNIYLPIWPFREYAQLCAVGEFKNSQPAAIDMQEFIADYLPDYRKEKYKLALFPVPRSMGTPMDIDHFVMKMAIKFNSHSKAL